VVHAKLGSIFLKIVQLTVLLNVQHAVCAALDILLHRIVQVLVILSVLHAVCVELGSLLHKIVQVVVILSVGHAACVELDGLLHKIVQGIVILSVGRVVIVELDSGVHNFVQRVVILSVRLVKPVMARWLLLSVQARVIPNVVIVQLGSSVVAWGSPTVILPRRMPVFKLRLEVLLVSIATRFATVVQTIPVVLPEKYV